MTENGQARQQLLRRLQQHIMAKLGFAEVIDPDQRLNDLGVDSLMSVRLSNSLEDEFGIPVPVAELIRGRHQPARRRCLSRIGRELSRRTQSGSRDCTRCNTDCHCGRAGHPSAAEE